MITITQRTIRVALSSAMIMFSATLFFAFYDLGSVFRGLFASLFVFFVIMLNSYIPKS